MRLLQECVVPGPNASASAWTTHLRRTRPRSPGKPMEAPPPGLPAKLGGWGRYLRHAEHER